MQLTSAEIDTHRRGANVILYDTICMYSDVPSPRVMKGEVVLITAELYCSNVDRADSRAIQRSACRSTLSSHVPRSTIQSLASHGDEEVHQRANNNRSWFMTLDVVAQLTVLL